MNNYLQHPWHGKETLPIEAWDEGAELLRLAFFLESREPRQPGVPPCFTVRSEANRVHL